MSALDEPDGPFDPFIQDIVERAAAPYRDRLTPEAFEEMRQDLSRAVTAHPALASMVERLRPRIPPPHTEEHEVGDERRSTGEESVVPPKRSQGSA